MKLLESLIIAVMEAMMHIVKICDSRELGGVLAGQE
jgi:hypothetical protein